MRTYWLNAALAALLSFALAMLAYGHDPDRSGPLVYAPDGTVAVLCLAGDQPDHHSHDMPDCGACRIAQAIVLPETVQGQAEPDWQVADAPVWASTSHIASAFVTPQLARAPPV